MKRVSKKKKDKYRNKLRKKVLHKERARALPTHRLMDELGKDKYTYTEMVYAEEKAYIREAKRRLHWWRFW